MGVSGVAVEVFSRESTPEASVTLEISEACSMGLEALKVSVDDRTRSGTSTEIIVS